MSKGQAAHPMTCCNGPSCSYPDLWVGAQLLTPAPTRALYMWVVDSAGQPNLHLEAKLLIPDLLLTPGIHL